jgi:hypothetical protein
MDEVDRTTEYDEQAEQHLQVQAEIQEVLDALYAEMAGAPIEDVAVAINVGLANAGIPEQPHRWVEGMAERISTGRPPVADTHAAVEAIRLAASDQASAESVPAGPGRAEPESIEPGAAAEAQATPPSGSR